MFKCKSENKKSKWGVVVLAFVLHSVGCGTWLGNPKDPSKEQPPSGNSMVNLKVQGELMDSLPLTANDIEVLGRSGGVIGTLTLTQARVALKEIRLNLSSGDSRERQEFEGPYIVNLLNSQMQPNAATIAIDAGSYTSINLKLAKLEKDQVNGILSEGDPLIERSIYLTGTYHPVGGASVSVTMDFDLDEEFTLGQSSAVPAAMQITEGDINSIIIAFRLDRWFDFSGSEFDFDNIEGNIVLTKDGEEAAKKVRESIKENIKISAKFGKDADGDGKLGADEDSVDE